MRLMATKAGQNVRFETFHLRACRPSIMIRVTAIFSWQWTILITAPQIISPVCSLRPFIPSYLMWFTNVKHVLSYETYYNIYCDAPKNVNSAILLRGSWCLSVSSASIKITPRYCFGTKKIHNYHFVYWEWILRSYQK